MRKTVTKGAMQAMERAAFSRGVPSLLLMENAARAVAETLLAKRGVCRALFACGCGNNGGDGLAAARIFRALGGAPVVALVKGEYAGDALANLKYARALGIPMLEDCSVPADCEAVVDAVFGTGLSRAPEGGHKALIDAINDSGKYVLSVDVPSGMSADTGDIPGACVRADTTVTFHRPKQGLYLTRRREWAGEIVIADIGLPPAFDTEDGFDIACPEDLPALLPRRARDAHKGECGRVLLYCGSMGMAGAAAVAARACVRAGAGLTNILCEREIMPILQTLCPCATCTETAPRAYDALALGCGLSQKDGVWENILRIFDPRKPSVWDADALNLLAARGGVIPGANAVLTPHPGEAARLLALSDADEIIADPVRAARAIAAKYQATVVLKGATTVIVSGAREALNVTGARGMAKGGSGDALTGVLAALLCHLAPFEAARAACLWHGVAGMCAECARGMLQMTAEDLIENL